MKTKIHLRPGPAGPALAAAIAMIALVAFPAMAGAADWNQVPIALPGGATGGFLSGADCIEADSCVAVGAYYTGVDQNALKPMVVTEAGGVWGQAASLGQPLGAASSQLAGVSCSAAGSCVAVGLESEGDPFRGEKRPIVAVETDGSWGATARVTPPRGAPHAILASVSCPVAGSCEAVGGDESGPFAIGETDGVWAPAVQIPPSSPAAAGSPLSDTISFLGVSCVGVGSCVGAGESWASGEQVPSAAFETAGSWAQAAPLTPPTGTGGLLRGVSCPTAGSCVVVGKGGTDAFAAGYADGSWGQSSPISPPVAAPSDTVAGVSCPATGSCVAAGSYYPTNSLFEGRPMIAPESGGTWGGAIPLDPPADATYAWLSGVSCPPAGACAAVGVSGTEAGELPLAYGGEPPAATEQPATETAQSSGSSSVKVTTIASSGGGGAIPTCELTLAGTSIQVTRAHAARVKLSDTGGAACKGTVSLAVPVKAEGKKAGSKSKSARRRKIGSASVRLGPGQAATIPVPLNGAGKAALARGAGRLKASLAVQTASARLAKSVHLHAAKTKRSRS